MNKSFPKKIIFSPFPKFSIWDKHIFLVKDSGISNSGEKRWLISLRNYRTVFLDLRSSFKKVVKENKKWQQNFQNLAKP